MTVRALLAWFALSIALAACREADESASKPAEPAAPPLPPPVLIDGSSTVLPITREVVKLFAENVTAEIKLSGAGTGVGLKKLCQREIAIAGASRPMRESEAELCSKNHIDFLELPIAFDGIAVVVNAANEFAKDITVAELKKLWSPAAEGKVKSWSDVRAGWPAKPIQLFGPGGESGTFDYFTESINGAPGASRKDYQASEDDDVLVRGVAENPYALGYFGFSYYVKNRARLRALSVDDGLADNGKGPIAPSPDTISDASYQPLSRPLFIYTTLEAAQRKEVDDLIRFYIRAARIVATDVGSVPLPDGVFELSRKRYVARQKGSVFRGLSSTIGITMHDLLEAENAEAVVIQ